MIKYLLTISVCLLSAVVYAQPMQPGWYILEQGSAVQLALPNANDIINYQKSLRSYDFSNNALKDISNSIRFKAGEVVLLYDKVDGIYGGFDPIGRVVFVKGPITRAEQTDGASVASVAEDVKMQDGQLLAAGMCVWVLGQGTGNNVKVQYLDGKIIELPRNKVNAMKSYMYQAMDKSNFSIVE